MHDVKQKSRKKEGGQSERDSGRTAVKYPKHFASAVHSLSLPHQLRFTDRLQSQSINHIKILAVMAGIDRNMEGL